MPYGLPTPPPRPEGEPAFGAPDPQGPHPEGRPGFAVAGLVLGIIPIFAGILGIVFGLIGRSQARSRGQRGETMGLIGAILGGLWLLLIIVIVAVNAGGDDVERDDAGAVRSQGDAAVTAVRTGDCLVDIDSLADGVTEIMSIAVIPCAQAHGAEIYSTYALGGSAFPGETQAAALAEKGCAARFPAFVGIALERSAYDLYTLYPTAGSWTQGDRKVNCVIGGSGLVGSAEGTRR